MFHLTDRINIGALKLPHFVSCSRSIALSDAPSWTPVDYARAHKGKSVPLQAWSGPEGSRKLRLLDYVTSQDGGKVKGKSVPSQAWSGPEGSSKLRFPVFMTTAQDGGKVASLTHRPPLTPSP